MIARERRLQRACTCGGTCHACRQRDRPATSAGRRQSAPPIVHDVLRSPGEPLHADVQTVMEQRFGHDFSNVRVHTGPLAAASAESVDARGYTVGSHIVLGGSESTAAERHSLLAHELTHVVQQQHDWRAGGALSIAGPHEPEEREAVRVEHGADLSARTHGQSQPRVMRKGKEASAKTNYFTYDRSNFDDRFDAEVDASRLRVWMIVNLDLEDMGKPEGQEERIAKFRQRVKDIVEATWSGQWALHSTCHPESQKFEARVLVRFSSANPHHTIRVWQNFPGERSSSNDWQQKDVEKERRTSPVLIDPDKPPTKDNIQEMEFEQVPAAHEFGHLIGLQHIVCAGNSDRCYGITADQKMDIMGYGSSVSKRDYKPFEKIMKRYGQDALTAECNSWRLVTPG